MEISLSKRNLNGNASTVTTVSFTIFSLLFILFISFMTLGAFWIVPNCVFFLFIIKLFFLGVLFDFLLQVWCFHFFPQIFCFHLDLLFLVLLKKKSHLLPNYTTSTNSITYKLLKFKSLISWNLFYGDYISFCFFHMDGQLYQHYLLNKLPFS